MKTVRIIIISCLVSCLITGSQNFLNTAYGSIITTITLQPGPEGKDAGIMGDRPNENEGNTTGTIFGSYLAISNRRVILEFDDLSTFSDIPRFLTPLTKAVFSFVEHSTWGGDPLYRAHLYRVTEPWNEGEVTWNNRTATELWATPGVSFAEEWAYADFTTQQWCQEIDFDVTELVRGWIDGTFPNYGMVLIPEALHIDGSPINNYTGFYLSDHTVPDLRPKLTLTGPVPEPATVLLLGLGGLALLRRHRV